MSLDNTLSIKLYQAIAEANEDRVYENWHASSMGMCPRAHYFKRLAVPELTKPTGAKVLRWGAGHHLEAAIRPYIEAVYGGLASNERMTSDKLSLTGEFDNLVLANNKLVEIKSVSDYAFYEKDGQTGLKKQDGNWPNGNKRWSLSDEPYLGHEIQNHAYVILLEELGKTVKEIDYVYISLSGRIVVYCTQVQQKYLDNVTARLRALNKAWETKEPPKCICTPEHPLWDSSMQWCPYRQEDKECCSLELIT
jgi:CRISPR/Cas system-associated exonuclease Cas4 (RecB family)